MLLYIQLEFWDATAPLILASAEIKAAIGASSTVYCTSIHISLFVCFYFKGNQPHPSLQYVLSDHYRDFIGKHIKSIIVTK